VATIGYHRTLYGMSSDVVVEHRYVSKRAMKKLETKVREGGYAVGVMKRSQSNTQIGRRGSVMQ
jgi:hypothetical protein